MRLLVLKGRQDGRQQGGCQAQGSCGDRGGCVETASLGLYDQDGSLDGNGYRSDGLSIEIVSCLKLRGMTGVYKLTHRFDGG